MLKGRIAELKVIRDQARADAERAEDAIERLGPRLHRKLSKRSPGTLASGCGPRAAAIAATIRAPAQRVEVYAKEVRIMGWKSVLLGTLVAAASAKTAGFGVPSFVSKWRATVDEDGHYSFAVPLRST
jgi:site-specific DNA recombinase